MRIIMKKKICVIILFFLLVVIDCSLLQQIQKRAAFYIAFEQQEFFQKLRNQEVSPETVLKFREYESEEDKSQDDMTFTRYLLAYYASDLTEKNELKDVYKRLLRFHKKEIDIYFIFFFYNLFVYYDSFFLWIISKLSVKKTV